GVLGGDIVFPDDNGGFLPGSGEKIPASFSRQLIGLPQVSTWRTSPKNPTGIGIALYSLLSALCVFDGSRREASHEHPWT
ncbi:MAG TPA: hypothetical protein PLB32_21675, partial [Acidobacteriota bacterium]|nr:hypothetical protein [Acidobacteriota bacterium]